MKTFALLVCTLLVASNVMADDYLDKIEAAFKAQKSATYPAQTFSTVMPYEVGQWVLYGQTDDDGDKSLYKMSIVGKNGSTMILETWMMDDDDIIVMQLHVDGMEEAVTTRSVDNLEFKKIVMQTNDDDKVVIDGFVLNLSSGVYRDAMEKWFHQSTNMTAGESLVTPAGTFAGTTKAESTIEIMGDEVEGTGWLHPAIPIYGLVKSSNDDGYEMIVLDFGTSGATSAIN